MSLALTVAPRRASGIARLPADASERKGCQPTPSIAINISTQAANPCTGTHDGPPPVSLTGPTACVTDRDALDAPLLVHPAQHLVYGHGMALRERAEQGQVERRCMI